MPPNSPANPAVIVVLHDVAPATWPACQMILNELSRCGTFPVTHLIVPDYHSKGTLVSAPSFRRAIDVRIARGDEPVLHGYHHLDTSSLSRNVPQRLTRSVYTAGEGEFSSLSTDHAARLIEKGLADMAALDWEVQGFVPPAWLASPGTRTALTQAGLRYTSTRRALIDLKLEQEFISPSLVWSTRAWWRRRASALWNSWLSQRLESQNQPLLRLGIHPADARHPEALSFWIRSLRMALKTRTPMTKIQWLSSHNN